MHINYGQQLISLTIRVHLHVSSLNDHSNFCSQKSALRMHKINNKCRKVTCNYQLFVHFGSSSNAFLHAECSFYFIVQLFKNFPIKKSPLRMQNGAPRAEALLEYCKTGI